MGDPVNLVLFERKIRTRNIAILIFLVGTVFSNVLSNGFVWDDTGYLLPVKAYRSLDLFHFFLAPGNGVEYLPIRDLSYVFDFALWGENAVGFHLTNLILYLLNVVAIYFLAETLLAALEQVDNTNGRQTIAFWTAALFALHPIHCEVVNFISGGRNTLLAGLFAFLASRSFILFLGNMSGHSTRQLVSAFIWYVLAVLSQATAVSLPLFFLPLCVLIRRRTVATRLASIAPFFAASVIVYVAYTSIAEKTGTIDTFLLGHLPVFSKIATAAQIPFFYLYKLIFPFRLSADYAIVFSPSLVSPSAVVTAILIIVLAIALFIAKDKAPLFFLSFFWYITALIPVLQLVPSPMIVADRYAYLPSFAFCFIAAVLVTRIMSRWPYGLTVTGGVVLFLYAFLSFQQNKVWKSNRALWEQTLSVSPRSLHALKNLGASYLARGDYGKAFVLFDRARQVDPMDTAYDFFKGHYFYVRGDVSTAMQSFENAIEKKNDMIDALYYMGEACDQLKKRDCAASYYQRVLKSQDVDQWGYKQMAAKRLAQLGSVQRKIGTK